MSRTLRLGPGSGQLISALASAHLDKGLGMDFTPLPGLVTTRLSITAHTGQQEAKGSEGLDPRLVSQYSPAQPSPFRGLAFSPQAYPEGGRPHHHQGRPRRYPVDKAALHFTA